MHYHKNSRMEINVFLKIKVPSQVLDVRSSVLEPKYTPSWSMKRLGDLLSNLGVSPLSSPSPLSPHGERTCQVSITVFMVFF